MGMTREFELRGEKGKKVALDVETDRRGLAGALLGRALDGLERPWGEAARRRAIDRMTRDLRDVIEQAYESGVQDERERVHNLSRVDQLLGERS